MELILFTYERFIEHETACIQRLMQQFPFTLHLRKPGARVEEYRLFLDGIPPEYHNKIMLHDAFELSNNYKVKGIHFSTRLRDSATNYPDVFKSKSCHSLTELDENKNNFDYLFLSPVFPSISKQGYLGDLNMKKVSTYLEENQDCSAIALGGINHSNIKQISGWGFRGAAVLGVVWGKNGDETLQAEENLKQVSQCMASDHIV